jgi:hypothetical protein
MPTVDPLVGPSMLTITPWPDPVIDTLGHDPRSPYVEQFWLAILGPSTTWLLRRLATGLEASPAGFELALEDTARSLGLGTRGGRNAPFMRSIARACQFALAAHHDGGLAVRRKLPPLNRQQVGRLPLPLQRAHQAWIEREPAHRPDARDRRRARHLALSLLELGEDVEGTERQLGRWRFAPPIARDATAWALSRHRQALAAADQAGDGDDAA